MDKPIIETFNEIERIVYNNAVKELKTIFEPGPRFGKAVQMVIDEIVDQRKFTCAHTNVMQTYPDWESLYKFQDVKTVVDSFRYLYQTQFVCHDCDSPVWPDKFKHAK